MDIGYMIQKVFYYMQNPEQLLPTANDIRQAAEIEKMRKSIEDLCEAKRAILPENQGIAVEIACLEVARQMIKDQQRGMGQ